MTSTPWDKDTTANGRLPYPPETNGNTSTPSARPADRAELTLKDVLELVVSLVDNQALQAETTQALLTALRDVINEQANLQHDIEQLHKRIDTIAAAHDAQARPAPESALSEGTLDGHRALRAKTQQARHHAQELSQQTAELSARAAELTDGAPRITDDAPRARAAPRSRP